MHEGELSLERWTNFYLVTSTAAATLIGLLFVVITIGADRMPGQGNKVRVYLTPTVIFFATVLLVATLLTFPNQDRISAGLCLGVVGLAGVVYTASLLVRRGLPGGYEDRSDWPPYILFPMLAYALLIASGALVYVANALGLTLAAIGVVCLLVLAIRNSWALAIAVATARSD